jgi:hypothetical protein
LAFSFSDRNGLADGDAGEMIDLSAGPANVYVVGFFALPETEGQN